MYNPEIKQRFMDENETVLPKRRLGKISLILSLLEVFEEKFSKDVAEFSFAEAKEAMENCGYVEFSTVTDLSENVKKYIDWCYSTGIFPKLDDGFLRLRADDLDLTDVIRAVYFKDEADFVSSLSSAVVRAGFTLDDGYVQPPILALAWLGLSNDEIATLQNNQVDFENRCIMLDSKPEITITDGVFDILLRYARCNESTRHFIRVFKDRSVSTFIKRILPENSKFFGQSFTRAQLTAPLTRFVESLDDDLSPQRFMISSIRRSGRYYSLWDFERTTGLDPIATENKSVINRIFGYDESYHSSYYDIKRMYTFYRKAFWQKEFDEICVRRGFVSQGKKSVEDAVIAAKRKSAN